MKHNMYLQARHKKGQQSLFMKKIKIKCSRQLFTTFSSKYNNSLKQMSRNVSHTYNPQWELIRFPSSTNVFATHGSPISNRLFWMSCLPSMVMQSCMHNSIRQPAWAHCRVKQRDFHSVTMELTGYTPPKVLVIRSEVSKTICQVIFHMMWVQEKSTNHQWHTHKRRKLNARYVPLPFGKTP